MTFIETLEQVVGQSANKHYHEMQQGDVVSTEADMTDFNRTLMAPYLILTYQMAYNRYIAGIILI